MTAIQRENKYSKVNNDSQINNDALVWRTYILLYTIIKSSVKIIIRDVSRNAFCAKYYEGGNHVRRIKYYKFINIRV